MATVDKDFRVKNGLVVTNGGSFGGPVTVAEPAEANHAVTRSYAESLQGVIGSGPVFPENPQNGQLFFDTVSEHVYVWNESAWYSIAMFNDTLDLPQHIHDTSIDGTGLVISIFKDAGFYNDAGDYTDAGFYNTVVFAATWDGGIAIDNFN